MERPQGKYIVINGIMKGLVFTGYPICIAGENRIWNNESTGQSFPLKNIFCLGAENEKVNFKDTETLKMLKDCEYCWD